MKLICFSQKRLDGALVYYPKTDNVLLRNNRDFYLPNFSQNIEAEWCVYLKVSKIGKCIAPEFAQRYYHQIGLAVNFSAPEVAERYRQAGLPVSLSYNFDYSTAVSKVLDIKFWGDGGEAAICSFVCNEHTHTYTQQDLVASLNECLVAYSQFSQVKIGDVLVIPFLHPPFQVEQGDTILSKIGNLSLLNFSIK